MKFRTNFEDLQKKIEEMANAKQREVLDEVDTALHLGAEDVRTDADLLTPVNKGDLAQSIEVTKVADCRYTVGSRLPYAKPVEFGSRPHWAPQDAIKEYARDIGKPDDWYGIWLAIGLKGTRPRPFLRPAFFKNETKIIKEVRAAVNRGLSNG